MAKNEQVAHVTCCGRSLFPQGKAVITQWAPERRTQQRGRRWHRYQRRGFPVRKAWLAPAAAGWQRSRTETPASRQHKRYV